MKDQLEMAQKKLARRDIRTDKIVDFAVPADHRVKSKESEKKDKYLDFTRELKKTVKHESDVYTNYHIYPTPPLGPDMTQGQFLSGV